MGFLTQFDEISKSQAASKTIILLYKPFKSLLFFNKTMKGDSIEHGISLSHAVYWNNRYTVHY